MKLNSNTFPSWLKSSAKEDIRFFLVYGYDVGQVKMLCDDLATHFRDKFSEISVLHFAFDQLKSNLASFKNELCSPSLFGEKKVIIITSCAAVIGKDFLETLKNDKSDSILIFQAEELRPNSTLRKTFETMDKCVAIACYKDDQVSLEKYIRQFFITKQVPIESNVPAMLASLLPANRLLVKEELEKLLLYKDDNEVTITAFDVSSVIADATDLSFDDLCTSYILGDFKNIQVQLKRVLNQNTNFMLIIRVLQKYLTRLFEVLNYRTSGLSMDEAVAKLNPPVFFKQKDNLLKVVKIVDLVSIKRSILSLLMLESKCKSGICDPELLLINFLVQPNSTLISDSTLSSVIKSGSPSGIYNNAVR